MPSSKSFHKEDIAGKTVIDSTGKVIGKVTDIAFTLDGAISLWVEKTDGSLAEVPLGKVMGVSDHVVVKEEIVPTVLAARPGMVRCKFCGTEAPVGTTWCPSCGRALG